MSALVVLFFLGLFSFSQALSGCEKIMTPLILEDDYKSIMGRWIFMEGIADHHLFTTILKTVNSSWIEFSPSPLENTTILSQGNMLNGKCEFSTINATIKDKRATFTKENETISDGRFLPSCPECLTMSFISQYKGETIRSLYFFKKDSKREPSDMETYWKQAQCLGFSRETQYSYDGVTEFCQVAKDSSPDQKPLSLDN